MCSGLQTRVAPGHVAARQSEVSEAMEVPLEILEFQEDGKVKATNGKKVPPNCIQILTKIRWDSTLKEIRSRKEFGCGITSDRRTLPHFLNDFAKWMEADGRLARTASSVARGDMHWGYLE